MDNPNAPDDNFVYGYDLGINLQQIQKAFVFNSEVWYLVLWEGYDKLEAVPAKKINHKFPLKVIEYFDNNRFLQGIKDNYIDKKKDDDVKK